MARLRHACIGPAGACAKAQKFRDLSRGSLNKGGSKILSFENSWELRPEFPGVDNEQQKTTNQKPNQKVMRVINAIANLRQHIHNASGNSIPNGFCQTANPQYAISTRRGS